MSSLCPDTELQPWHERHHIVTDRGCAGQSSRAVAGLNLCGSEHSTTPQVFPSPDLYLDYEQNSMGFLFILEVYTY